MSEVPDGLHVSAVQRKPPRPTATLTLTREGPDGVEVLLGCRAPTMRAFPDYWAFCGGGVSRHDTELAQELSLDQTTICILREMCEELGILLTQSGVHAILPSHRKMILEQKDGFHALVRDGTLNLDTSRLNIFSHRITPPFGPIQFDNAFMHIHLDILESEHLGIDLEPQTEFTEIKWATPHKFLDEWKQHKMKIAPPVVTLLMEIKRTLERLDNDMTTASQDISERKPGRKSILFSHGVEVVPIKTATLPPADHTNCYLVGDPEGEFIIVDPAVQMRESIEELATAVDRHHGTPLAIAYTHTHSDHVGDIGLLKEAFDLPIWASEPCSKEMHVDRILRDGDILELGKQKWTVLFTPGHHPGHLCFFSEAGLVAGDMVAGFGTILIPSSEGNMEQYLAELTRLRNLKPHLIFPSHGPVIAQPQRILMHYIQHRQHRQNRILEGVKKGLTSLQDIAIYAYEDSPDAHPGLAKDQTLSHLLSMVRLNLIQQKDSKWICV